MKIRTLALAVGAALAAGALRLGMTVEIDSGAIGADATATARRMRSAFPRMIWPPRWACWNRWQPSRPAAR